MYVEDKVNLVLFCYLFFGGGGDGETGFLWVTSPGCLGLPFVGQPCLKLRDPSASASRVWNERCVPPCPVTICSDDRYIWILKTAVMIDTKVFGLRSWPGMGKNSFKEWLVWLRMVVNACSQHSGG